MTNKFPIVLTCDSNYVPFTAVTLKSLVINCKTRNVIYDIYIINNDITQEQEKYLKKIAKLNSQINLSFIKISHDKYQNVDSKLELLNYISVSTYFRLEIPRLFINKYDYVLYLDCDLILVNFDPYQITKYNDELDQTQNILAGVKDSYINRMLFDQNISNDDEVKAIFNLDYCKNVLKINNPQNYVNAGVLYFNLKAIRHKNYVDEFSNILQEITSPCFKDQDLLNALSLRVGDNLHLPNQYNLYLTNSDWKQKLDIKKPSKIRRTIDEYFKEKLYPNNLSFNIYDLSIKTYVKSLTNISGIFHFLSPEKPWNHHLAVDSFQLWWAVAYTLPNFEKDYANKILNGQLKKFDKSLLKTLAKKYFRK